MSKLTVETLNSEKKYFITNRISPLETKKMVNRIAPNRVFNNNNSDFEIGCWFDDEKSIDELVNLCESQGWLVSNEKYRPLPEAKATQRQINYIIDLGGDVTDDMTISQASALIDELLADK